MDQAHSSYDTDLSRNQSPLKVNCLNIGSFYKLFEKNVLVIRYSGVFGMCAALTAG